MIWVPPGYTFGEAMFGLDEVRGGSGWGAGTFAGPTGQRQPTQVELLQAEHQVRTGQTVAYRCYAALIASCCLLVMLPLRCWHQCLKVIANKRHWQCLLWY